MRARVQAINGKFGIARTKILVVVGYDKHNFGLLLLEHFVVIVISPWRTELTGARFSAADIQIANGYEINRRVLERGINVPLGMSPATDERRLQFLWILVIISYVIHQLVSDDSGYVDGVELFADGGVAQY